MMSAVPCVPRDRWMCRALPCALQTPAAQICSLPQVLPLGCIGPVCEGMRSQHRTSSLLQGGGGMSDASKALESPVSHLLELQCPCRVDMAHLLCGGVELIDKNIKLQWLFSIRI